MRLPLRGFVVGFHAVLLALGGISLVVLIAVLDYWTGPYLSFGIFYLIPVALCAWWGGFSYGILLSIAGAIASHAVDSLENPLLPAIAAVWNGIVRFGTLSLTSSLISRLHAGVLRERLLASTDALTGAANARIFYEVTAKEAERARRAARPLTLAYLDLDNFKQLNDRFGHAAGDAALLHVVQTIRLHLRDADLIARLGGDEFALLLPETESEGAVALLKRVQEVLSLEMVRQGWPVTLSVGAITFLQPLVDVDLMIHRVDALMYGAKRKGKGRVEYEVVRHAQEFGKPNPVERRATARLLCSGVARIRREGQEADHEEFATVQDISAGGVGLFLKKQLQPNTVLIVEPLTPGPRTLLARVVRATPKNGGWVHGCMLPSRLIAEDLSNWLGHLENS